VADLSLKELVRETLIQKHRRLMQEKCSHNDIHSSTVSGPDGTFTNSFWNGKKSLSEPDTPISPAERTET